MRPAKTQWLLVGLTVLALSAGVVAGLLASRLPAGTGGNLASDAAAPPPMLPPPGPMAGASLTEQLQLTPDQAERMRAIWENIRGEVHKTFEDAQDLHRQRDQELVGMLSDEQKARFQKISQAYADRWAALGRSRDEMFQNAVRQSRELLDERQREKYDQILKTHVRPGTPAAVVGASARPTTMTSPAERGSP